MRFARSTFTLDKVFNYKTLRLMTGSVVLALLPFLVRWVSGQELVPTSISAAYYTDVIIGSLMMTSL